jgi:hypothetical protein
MSVVYFVEHRTLIRLPKDYLTILLQSTRTSRCTGEEFLFERMPGNNRDLVLMSFKAIELFVSLADIKDFNLLVLARR